MIHIPKKLSYNAPDGDYRVELKDVIEFEKQRGNKMEKITRFVYQIVSLKHPRFIYLAGKSYKTSKMETLGEDLDSWLGEERLNAMMNAEGGLTIELLQGLIGEHADIRLVHIDNDEYDHPFCHIQAIYPPGTLVADEPDNKDEPSQKAA